MTPSSSSGSSYVDQLFYVALAADEKTPAVRVRSSKDPSEVLRYLGMIDLPSPAIFITGGAGGMADDAKARTRRLFDEAIAPFAEEHQAVVIDGATDYGVIEMMSNARLIHNFTFPLVGVAPYGKVSYPGKRGKGDTGDTLADGHTHFVFVTGNNYGDESKLLLNLAHAVAGGTSDPTTRQQPVVGIVINGGEITSREAYMATSKGLSIPLIVIEDAGRFSSDLASAVKTGKTDRSLLKSIVAHGNIELVSTTQGPQAMRAALERVFRAFASRART